MKSAASLLILIHNLYVIIHEVVKLPESFLENLSVFSQRADATLHRKYTGSRICVQVFEPSMKEQGKNALGLSGFLFLKVQLSSLMNTTSVHCLQG